MPVPDKYKVAPDGTAYVPNKNCQGLQGVAVSTNSGTTWTVRTVPGSASGEEGGLRAIPRASAFGVERACEDRRAAG